jgi:hypothetical protein
VQPGIVEIADAIVSHQIDHAHDRRERGHDQADAQQPERGVGPKIIRGSPERHV